MRYAVTQRMLARARRLTFGCALALACVAATSPAASTSSTVVGATVPGATSLLNACRTPTATAFGSVAVATSNRTATGAGVCRLDFGSSNSTATLQVRQADRRGTAMASSNGAWTSVRNSSPGLQDVAIASQLVRYVSGEQGRLLRTPDSGSTWVLENAQTTETVRDVDAVDDDTAYAVGGGCFFGCPFIRKRTFGGGSTWAVQTVPGTITGNLAGVDHVPSTPATAVAVGANGKIARTVNGGSTWAEVASPTTDPLVKVEFLDNLNVFAVGGNGTIIRSTDAGLTWAVVPGSPTATSIADLTFSTASTMWIVTQNTVFRSTNPLAATPTWSNLGGPSSIITGISAASATDVWLSAWGGLAVSNNANQVTPTWSSINYPITTWPSAIEAYSATDATIAAWGGTIARSVNGTSVYVERNEATSVVGLDSSGDTSIGVGDYGFIERTTDAGATWATIPSGTTRNLWDVAFVDDTTAVAVGQMGTLLRSTNSGATWSSINPGFAGNPLLRAVAGGAGMAIVVGDGGFAARSTDGGSTWTTLATGTGAILSDVAIAGDDGTTWIVGTAGLIRRSIDRGATWTDQSIGGTDLLSVAAPGNDVAWASGKSTRLVRTTDRGATWSPPATLPTPAGDLMAIDAIDSSNAIAVGGAQAQRAVTADGGATWTTTTGLFNVTSVSMPDANTALAGTLSGGVFGRAPVTTIPDFNAATANWGSAGGMFGACLQDAALGATASWTEDVTGIPGTCEAANTDPWNDIPTTNEAVATTTVAGATGRADIVWGLRVGTSQPAGTYTAGVEFTVVSP